MNNTPTLRVASAVLAGCLLLSAGSYGGYRYGRYGSVLPPSDIRNATNVRVGSSSEKTNFGLFWQAWNIIDDKFNGDASSGKRLDGAIGGMVAGLGDPYTLYLPPSQNNLFQSQLQGNFGGIGAELNVKNGVLTIVAPLQDSPSAKAGLKAQDVILKIDGQKVEGLPLDDAVNKIRGPKGSSVTLNIARAGTDAPFDVAVQRDTITVKSVKTERIGAAKNVAYIKLNQFGSDTTELFRQALKDTATADGIVIDLRDDPGGYLQGAADDIGMLLPATVTSDKQKLVQKVAVVERFRDGKEQNDPAGTESVVPTKPIVVLVNGGSASASEIFSGAMRDYNRAKLVGTKTFGKGSAQEVVPLSNGGAVKVTVAKWFTPLGTGIDGKGLEPDVKVELPKDVSPSSSDVQVAKALEILGIK